jgi:hypothetical protein
MRILFAELILYNHRHWHDSPLWTIAFLGFPDNRNFTGCGCVPHAQLQPGGPVLYNIDLFHSMNVSTAVIILFN